MTKRRAVLGALSAVVASVFVTLLAGGGVAAESNANLRAATVHPQLLEQLQSNPTGGVNAVVTTWNRAGLDDVELLGVTGTKLKALPMVLTTSLTLAQLEALQGSAAVRSVWPNEKFESLMEDTTWITRARYVWGTSNGSSDLPAFGATGKGVELAVIDTGFDGMHEDGDNLIEFCETLQAVTSDRNSVLCSPWDPDFNPGPAGPCGALAAGEVNPFPDPLDPLTCADAGIHPARGDSRDEDVSHGTHVGGTMAGTGHASGGTAFNHSTIGMSPHAKLRVYSANVGSSLFLHQILSSYDDMTYKKQEGYNRVVAVNNSWGGGTGLNYDPEDPIHVAVEEAWRAGILSVFAAGNSGPEHNTLSRQCVSPFVACIAATTKPDSVVMFSSRGRPSQPSDTNRDGVVDDDDVEPDNHDWRLGQALTLGRYRPTVAAPGVNINSMKAIGANIGGPDSAGCREDNLINLDQKAGCYVQINGTSMATPHVTGAIGLITQAFRQGHDGRTPRPNELIDILERSANVTKLPAYESEEQGAGRLDAYEAVKFARTYPNGLRRPNLGYPTPPYVANQYPGQPPPSHPDTPPSPFRPGSDPDRFYDELGCTGTASWSQPNLNPFFDPIGQPPGVAPQRYGQHFIDVPEKTDRLRITARWTLGDNLYLRLWRPGVNPDAESATPDFVAGDANPRSPAYHQSRVVPDQEAVGLVFTGDSRWLDVRSPEEANPNEVAPGLQPQPPTLPPGRWILRVYHRVGPHATVCGATQENPKQIEGHKYRLRIEMPAVTHRPSVQITDPPANSTQTGRFVEIRGKAGYPPPDAPPVGNVGHSWEGITNWEVPGSRFGVSDEPDPDNRQVLYFHGNPVAPLASPDEAACNAEGRLSVATVASSHCPFLHPSETLSDSPTAARWTTQAGDNVIDGLNDRTVFDPNWIWCLAAGPFCPSTRTGMPGPTTVAGPMTVEWWAMCAGCIGAIGFDADWVIKLWADGVLRFEQRVTASPQNPLVPEELKVTVNLPQITANQRFTLHIDPVYIDSQVVATIYYDSQNACDVAGGGNPCDSLVKMPVGQTGGGGRAAGPENVRVTDLPHQSPYPGSTLSPALRVAWDEQPGASEYWVYRSTNPLSLGSRVFRGSGTACVSPEAPTPNNPPGHDRAGRCFTDTNVSLRTTYYYRVVSIVDGERSEPSEVAYGTPTRYDRQVKLKVDRLYGPQYWEYALLPPSPNPTLDIAGTEWRYPWDTLELIDGIFFVDTTLNPATGDLSSQNVEFAAGAAHLVFARSFTQGIGSTKDGRPLHLDDDDGGGGPGPGPGCPDDDDGDGDDDGDDGDSDDNGDDGDDDCEDDNDDEEEDDD